MKYAPLQFIDDNKSPITVPGARQSIVDSLNERFRRIILQDIDIRCAILGDSIYNERVRLDNIYIEDSLVPLTKACKNASKEIMAELGLEIPGGNTKSAVADFMQFALKTHVINEWENNKIVYKLDNDMLDALLDTELPEKVDISLYSKLPCNCFYLDFNGKEPLIKNSDGCLVYVKNTGEAIHIKLFTLIFSEDRKYNKIMHAISEFVISGKDSDKINILANVDKEEMEAETSIELEDGTIGKIKTFKIYKLLTNFLLYLNASNKDIEISERTKQIYRKPKQGAKPKNKISEIEEFDVGLRFGSIIRANKVKVKYIDSEDNQCNITENTDEVENKTHGTKRSHFRQAHWHTYWIGTGEDKHKELKWVHGIFVNGGSKDLVIHKVQK